LGFVFGLLGRLEFAFKCGLFGLEIAYDSFTLLDFSVLFGNFVGKTFPSMRVPGSSDHRFR
jgi:hypothetical protein